jgi:hypothetical protein
LTGRRVILMLNSGRWGPIFGYNCFYNIVFRFSHSHFCVSFPVTQIPFSHTKNTQISVPMHCDPSIQEDAHSTLVAENNFMLLKWTDRELSQQHLAIL